MHINALRVAFLDDLGTGMSPDLFIHLWNTPYKPSVINHNIIRTAIELYLKLSHADCDYITTTISYAWHLSPDDDEGFPSLYKVKKVVMKLSGIAPIEHDMNYTIFKKEIKRSSHFACIWECWA